MLGNVGFFYTTGCWEVNKDGQVSRKEEIEYFLSSDFQVETTAELAADEVREEDGSIIASQISLPMGIALKPLRTDDKTFVDFIDKEERVYRVAFEIKIDPDYGSAGFVQGMTASDCMRMILGN